MHKVLVIDDEENIRLVLSELLSMKGFSISQAHDGPSGIREFGRVRPHAVLLDHRMPGMDGFETLKAIKEIDPAVPVIFLTAYADIQAAVEAIKSGAHDFVTKPADMESLTLLIRKAVEKLELEREVARLKSAVDASLEAALGRGEAIRRVIGQLVRVAASDFSIIIQGETGTGKSMVAGLIHRMSRRKEGPFVRVDMGAIPEPLIESELFGSEKGAFTGADRARGGYFEAASGGTLFIDELENTSAALQSKLLGAVEARQVCRVGSSKPVPVDARILAASNKDLRVLVKEGSFREDLYFRLNEFTVTLPPLRERADDISFLAGRFLADACEELKRPPLSISDPAMESLLKHPWSGNIRELKNVMRRAALLAGGPEVFPAHLDLGAEEKYGRTAGAVMPLKEVSSHAAREAERAAIREALKLSSGNKSRTASVLKIDYKTLLTKIKAYDLE
ncbi:sigma-54 dependent transcriptional regulator [bacterium]|nr:sigma-54 dependent transcriptional regulator [bacterium]